MPDNEAITWYQAALSLPNLSNNICPCCVSRQSFVMFDDTWSSGNRFITAAMKSAFSSAEVVRQHGLHEASFGRLAGLACRYGHQLTVAIFWSCNVQHAATVLYGKKISGSTNMAENLLLRVCVRWHADLLLVHHVLSSAHPRCAGSRPDSEVSQVLSSCNTCLSLLTLVLERCTARMCWLIFFCSLPQ